MTAKHEHGPTVLAGGTATAQIQYLSVSQITTFDETQHGGCERRWWYEKIERRTKRANKAQLDGIQVHKQIEHLLKTGEDVRAEVAFAGKRFLPAPGPDLLIEHSIKGLTAGGFPIVGYIDLVHARGEYIDQHGNLTKETAPTVEVIDHKTTGDFQRAKQSAELAATVQMVGYGMWGTKQYDVSVARLSHIYYRTRGAPISEKRTTTVTRAELEDRWARVDQVAARMAEVAKVPEARGVRGNEEACYAFGKKGCDFLEHCPRSEDRFMLDLFNKHADGKPGEAKMSLLDLMRKSVAGVVNGNGAVPPPVPEDTPIPVVVPAPAEPEVAKLDPMRCVKCESPVNYAGVQAGEPRWWHNPGPCAFADNTVKRSQIYPKAGTVDPSPVTAADFTPSVKCPFSCGTTLDPAGENYIHPKIGPHNCRASGLPVSRADVLRGPIVEEAPAPISAPIAAPIAAPAIEAEKRKRGRPKKAQPDTLETNGVISLEIPSHVDESTPEPEGIHLLIDVAYERGEWSPQSLDGYIDECCASLAEAYKVDDIRFAMNDNALAYSRWKGALAVVVRERPPAPGVYLMNNLSQSEIHQVVAQTLKPMCLTYVRGVR